MLRRRKARTSAGRFVTATPPNWLGETLSSRLGRRNEEFPDERRGGLPAEAASRDKGHHDHMSPARRGKPDEPRIGSRPGPPRIGRAGLAGDPFARHGGEPSGAA